MLFITNNGQAITSTNYWESEMSKNGYCFLSWNAGAGRVLVPDELKSAITEMRLAKYVIVSRGPWHEAGNRDAIELLFEDESENPFCLHLVAEQTDRTLPEEQQGSGFVITVWTRDRGEELRPPGRYRTVDAIPCLKPWSSH